VPFAYYARLPARQQAVYRSSDAVSTLPVPQVERLWPFVACLREALEQDRRLAAEAAANALVQGLMRLLVLPPVRVRVLAVRPSSSRGELHGLYTARHERAGVLADARIDVWMRTARLRRVVGFRTFLRTLLHEVVHHLDYHLLRLPDSLHTQGFFRRENSLFRQLVPDVGRRSADQVDPG
jgi:hypothetical protein